MRYRQLFAAATFVVLSASCMVSEPGLDEVLLPIEQKEITIIASLGEPDTRTERAADGSVLWSPGDQISLFYGSGENGGSCFTAQNTETAKTVNFTGTIGVITGGNNIAVEDTYFWAVYPYNATASCDGTSITTVLPAEQVATADTFADDLFPSMGRSQGLNMAFYNICGGIKFTVSEEGIKSVTLKGNSGEQIAGTITENFDSNNLPAVTNIADGSDTITLSAPEGETLIPGKAYYIVLVPTVFESGFTLTFSKGSTCAHKEFTSTISIRRSVFGTLTTPDKELEWEVDVAAQLALEREALIAFYNAMDGDNWYNNDNWCSDKPLGDWYGVYCEGGETSNSVVVLDLGYNGLCGTIPTEISDLTNLGGLRLNGSILSDNTFPSIITTLHNLNWIDLSNCNLLGKLPREIAEMPNLHQLILLNNDFSNIPQEIFQMNSLNELQICANSGSITIPSEIGGLTNLHTLVLIGDGFTGELPESVFSLPNLRELRLSCSNVTGEISQSIGNLKHLWLFELNGKGFSGIIPDAIKECEELWSLIICNTSITGTIPSSLQFCSRLEYLKLQRNELYGELPRELGSLSSLKEFDVGDNKLSGTIPEEYGGWTSITGINLTNNKLSGMIPESTGTWLDSITNPYGLNIEGNNFSGSIPESWQHSNLWKTVWYQILASGNFNNDGLYIPAPEISGFDIFGNKISSSIYRDNSLTILYKATPQDAICYYLPTMMKQIYDKYHPLGLEIVQYSDGLNNESANHYASEYGITWKICDNESIFIDDGYGTGIGTSFPKGQFFSFSPSVIIVNRQGLIVFDSYNNSYNSITYVHKDGELCVTLNGDIHKGEAEFQTFLDLYYGGQDYYCSTDYTSNGEVSTLQQSTAGAGVDLVLMGDAFSDRQIADGTYGTVMQNAMNAFFSEEPYKSMKDRFNVYTVNVVSATEGYEHGGQTLSTGHGDGTSVYGNDSKVIEYAKAAIGGERMDDAVIIVMMNEDAYAGTCFMYNPPSGNYGRGLSIAYFPVSSDEATFNGLVSHEAGGHGFAKLADEYAYEYNGAISDDAIANTRVNETYGWWKNVDFTNDPSQVKWSQFLNDERYAGEGLGCYEGGLTYWTGVWRPTENSIMRHNTGGFNAPSRYAIWYRINKLAYGENWNGTYEDFVAFDAPNRTPAAAARRAAKRANYDEKQFQPLAPPVVVGHSWREELQKSK